MPHHSSVTCGKAFKCFTTVKLHKLQSVVNAGHQQIGWAAGLVNMQEALHQRPIDPFPFYMEKRRLCQRRERLMHAMNHQIRTGLTAVRPKALCQSQMGSMCLIHDQGNPLGMYRLGYRLHVCHPALIGRWHNEHGSYVRLLLKSLPNLFRRDGIINIIFLHIGRPKIRYGEISQICPMICRSMTVAIHQNMSPRRKRAAHRTQNSASTSVNKIEAFVRTIDPGSLLLEFLQYPLRLMKIVESLYLRDV